MSNEYPKKKVWSKTFISENPEQLDEITNDFREKNKCIATQINACITPQGRIILIQTIFYTH